MNRLKDTVPFDEPEEKEEKSDCIIKNWKTNKEIKFKSIKEGKEMKFDFVIGNPPYQESDGGNGASAKPVYQYFVEEAKKFNPICLTMIIPARWYAGGKGLDEFRNKMLNDKRLTYLVDYINAKDCFKEISLSGGICIFLWKRECKKSCTVVNINSNYINKMDRDLNEYPIFVRYNGAISIIRKVIKDSNGFVSSIVSGVSPFGIETKVRGEKQKDENNNITLHSSSGITYINSVSKGKEWLNCYKVMISQTSSEHAGEPSKNGKFGVISSSLKALEPNEVCTQSYLTIGKFDNMKKTENCCKYFKTKFVRFLILQTLTSIHLTKSVFRFVPLQDFTENSDIDWTKSITEIDKQLYKKYNLSQEEIDFIESHVKEME